MKRKIGLYLLPCSTVGRPIRACKDGMIMKSMSASAATATHYMYGSFKLDLSTLLARSSLEILIGHLRRKKEKQMSLFQEFICTFGSVFAEVCPSLT